MSSDGASTAHSGQGRAAADPLAPPRVLVADDEVGMRAMLKRWLEQGGLFRVAGEATDGVGAVELATRLRPDLVVLDLAMPRMNGLEASAEIRRLVPRARIIVRSSFSAARMAQQAIEAGADVYVEKDAESEHLLDVIEGLFPGRRPHPAEARSGASRRGAGSPPRSPGPGPQLLGEASETTELLEAAVVSSPVGTVLLDASARLVIANPVADRLLGGSFLLGAARPSRILRRADTQEPVREDDLPVRAACAGDPFDDVELFVDDEDRSGCGTYVKISGRPVTGPQGSPAGAVISVQDVTPIKQAEQALAATLEELRRSNTELADFASTASHDLSQPLQQIYGFAQLLQQRNLHDEHAGEYVDRMVVACERMRTLIRDLLAYSRLTSEARPFEPVDLTAVVDETVELYDREVTDRGARIVVDPLPEVLADRTQMGQLFQNLIGNALTYVAAGVDPRIQVSSTRGEREWQLCVADNGIGIGAENRHRAFAMFQRLVTSEEYPGTGIGLAVCAKIVDRHGGRIWIDENAGGGSSICFTLPDRARG